MAKKMTKKAKAEKKYGKFQKLDNSVITASKEGDKARGGKGETTFGHYKEDVGGGEPMGQGVKYPDKGRGVWTDKYDKEPMRTTHQPRTNDGKFTYNSVNGRGTEYESRGKTVNPLLTGGKNGVMIDDVEDQFKNKSGDYWDRYKDIWYQEGSEAIKVGEDSKGYKKLQTMVTIDSIWNVAKHFNPLTGEFDAKPVYDVKTDTPSDRKGETENWKVKKGRPSLKELAAKQSANKNKAEQWVKDKDGSIAKAGKLQLKPGATIPTTGTSPTAGTGTTTPNPTAGTNPTTGTNPTAGASASVGNSGGYQSKYDPETLEDCKRQLVEAGLITEEGLKNISQEDLDSIIDECFKGEGQESPSEQPEEENSAPEASAEEKEEENSSDEDGKVAEKLKKYGFGD